MNTSAHGLLLLLLGVGAAFLLFYLWRHIKANAPGPVLVRTPAQASSFSILA